MPQQVRKTILNINYYDTTFLQSCLLRHHIPTILLNIVDLLLWNHLNSWGVGQFSWIVVILLICGDLFLWMLPFLVSVRNLTHLKFVFIEDVNSWGRTNLEYHENWATMSSNESTVNVSPNGSTLQPASTEEQHNKPI